MSQEEQSFLLSGCLTVKSGRTSGCPSFCQDEKQKSQEQEKKVVQGNGFQGASQQHCIRTWNCTLSEERLSWLTDQEIP